MNEASTAERRSDTEWSSAGCQVSVRGRERKREREREGANKVQIRSRKTQSLETGGNELPLKLYTIYKVFLFTKWGFLA